MFPPISLTAFSPRSWSLPETMTAAPSHTSNRATARPMPAVPPVINAVWFVNSGGGRAERPTTIVFSCLLSSLVILVSVAAVAALARRCRGCCRSLRWSDSALSNPLWTATVATAATPATIALNPATGVAAGGNVAYQLAVKPRTLIVRGLSEGPRWQHDHQGSRRHVIAPGNALQPIPGALLLEAGWRTHCLIHHPEV